jgi:hypothetical protein
MLLVFYGGTGPENELAFERKIIKENCYGFRWPLIHGTSKNLDKVLKN